MVIEHKVVLPLLQARKDAARRKNSGEGLKVNLGGGYFLRENWLTMDYCSPAYPYANKYIDINFDLMSDDPFPFEDESVECFYSSHTLEHIPQEYCDHIFAEFHRCLRPGGVARVTMPDYDCMYDAYCRRDASMFENAKSYGPDEFERLLISSFATGIVDDIDPAEVRERFRTMDKEAFADHYAALVSREKQRQEGGNHINWWNYEKLERSFAKAGFAAIYRSSPLESRCEEMRDIGSFYGFEHLVGVRRIIGFDNPEIAHYSVYAEAVK